MIRREKGYTFSNEKYISIEHWKSHTVAVLWHLVLINYNKNNQVVKFYFLVYVFVADNEALIDFATYMEKQDYLSKGEYVIISVDDEIHNETDSGQYIMKGIFQYIFKNMQGTSLTHSQIVYFVNHIIVHDKHLTLNETVAQPFRSVLKLTPSPPIDSGFDQFVDTVRNLSTKSPFNVPMWLPILVRNFFSKFSK